MQTRNSYVLFEELRCYFTTLIPRNCFLQMFNQEMLMKRIQEGEYDFPEKVWCSIHSFLYFSSGQLYMVFCVNSTLIIVWWKHRQKTFLLLNRSGIAFQLKQRISFHTCWCVMHQNDTRLIWCYNILGYKRCVLFVKMSLPFLMVSTVGFSPSISSCDIALQQLV